MLNETSGTNWEFEGFKVMKSMRLLIAGGTPVPLTSKAFDTLVVLIENRDRVVTKDELLRSVWPDVEVEEGNLTQQIFLLRKALGETAQQPRFIVTIPGHGYRFTARATPISGDAEATAVSTNDATSPPAAPRREVISVRIGLALFGVIALLAIVIGSWWMAMGRAGVPPDFTRHTTQITASGKATRSAISRDGRYVAYVENDGDEYSLWLKQVGGDGRTQVAPRQPLELTHLSFSPDGEYIYFARRSPRGPMFILYRIPTLGGLETPLLEDVDSPVSFSPDGRELVFLRGSEIVLAAPGGGSQRILARRVFPVRFSTFAPDWSPDGKVVATAEIDVSKGSLSVVLLSVDDGSSRELYRTESSLGRLRWQPDGSGLLTVISEQPHRVQSRLVSGGAIWRIAYPSGRAERLTSDLSTYDLCCLDIGANGRVVASVINTLVSDLRIAPADRLDALKQVTWDQPVVFRHSWLTDNDTIVYRDLSGRLNAVRKDSSAFSLPMPDGQKVVGGVSACGDGRYVVYSAMPGRNIWRVMPHAGNAVRLTRGLNDFNPACSPDGQSVLYASREQDDVSLWRVPIEDGGKPTPLDLTKSYDVLPSPSGRKIYYSTEALPDGADRNRPDRWVVISSSDRTTILLDVERTGDETIGVMTNWAPDESGLDYVVTRNGVSNIWRQRLTKDAPVPITRFSTGKIFSFAWSPNGQWLSLASGFNRSDVVLISVER